MKIRETLPIIRITGDKKENLSDTIVTETPITIFLNDQEIVTIICTPENILYLTAGYLFSERFIRTKQDIICGFLKIIKAEVPILISRSAPTTKAVSLSKVFGVTLVGFARGKKFNIYSNEWRVIC